jgi:hypothetical protein
MSRPSSGARRQRGCTSQEGPQLRGGFFMRYFPDTSMAAVFQNRLKNTRTRPAWRTRKTPLHGYLVDKDERDGPGACTVPSLERSQKRRHIAIFPPPVRVWVTDLAVLSAGGIDVPINPTNSQKRPVYPREFRGPHLLCGTKDQMNKVLE